MEATIGVEVAKIAGRATGALHIWLDPDQPTIPTATESKPAKFDEYPKPKLIISVAGKEHRIEADSLIEGNTVGVLDRESGERRAGGWWSVKSKDPDTKKIILLNDSEDEQSARSFASGDIPVAIAASDIAAGAVTISVCFKPTEARLNEWRHEAYIQIRQAYDTAVASYQAAVEGAVVSAGIEVEGRSPTENRRLERDEVKKQAITAFTRHHFSSFGAIEQAGVGDGPSNDPRYEYPELDLSKYQQQGKVIRFFEQAFEWEHMSWVLYPYYWSRKTTWIDKLSTTGADPQHVSFLRAGAARVQVPVRPDFELAVMHYQSTGEVWEGNQPPQVHEETYLPIVEELAEQLDRPDEEETPEGAPWEVRLPTDLVKLNSDGTLPEWEQNEEGEWVVVMEEEPDDDS